ncbi:bifunctional oligoribonuclease and PAP phosphatase NrnA [Clostridium homopropionicum DSM 5847]|uniref:Bifunctional oligoribonuclease and PAP phosphatase NrnA n=1 Tax=Clostridium homopropionicum DSM 5847 TaxID=1121318 RepID=A0A0L6ZDK5_9CLOT|nr:bifunctional oligoribonuclease/PAP phosphatase NrnA [Clostridium homopropionicum]KOA20878.1 bifunctional oligoribonuclease and PAP phosphatase NrnA [Clostridium homopropionicum DSM 5847]SFG03052.1 phosphoesterase RecJ domain-containing protein [Clostridium homopropionicum]
MAIRDIVDKLIECNKVGITCHVSPDGDSLGSSLAFLQVLLKLGKDAYIISKEPLPKDFSYLPYSNEFYKQNNTVLENTDVVIVLDCGNIDRINGNLNYEDKQYTLINIDHHLSNDLYGDMNYIDIKAAAVAEIVYEILTALNIELDKNIATCLYTSLVTDTGSFRHSNTTLNTHRIAGILITTGIDFTEIHRILFENKSVSRVKLYGKVIDGMEMYLNNKLCIMHLNKNILGDPEENKGDTSDIITIGTQIDSVEVTALIKDTEQGTKVSLRSKNVVDVRKIAEEFQGGGHVRAAGFSINENAETIKSILINKLENELI